MALSEQQYRKILVENKKILNEYEFGRAIREAADSRRPLAQVLLERAYLSPTQFLQLLADYFQVPPADLTVSSVDAEVLHMIPEDFAKTNHVLAFGFEGDAVKVALEDPSNNQITDQLEGILQKRVALYVASEYSLRRGLAMYGGDLTLELRSHVAKFERLSEAGQNDTVSLLTSIMEAAVLMDASDVHIEQYESELIVRFRIDGLLRTIVTIRKNLSAPILARLKIISELKVDQNRLPQDGRFTQVIRGQEVNFRISTVPTVWGEKAVLRVLPREAHLFDLHNLGLLNNDLATIQSYLKLPHGMILVTGPTGSGKTTTLYACLQEIGNNRIEVVNINTIEDPVEYTMPRINQIQTQAEIDLTFASGLRALLRQDPDIIMVGEIRDEETADFAIRSALVGRLVLSSLHTNDAASTILRLLDMGIEPYLISSTLALVVTQRLARRLCVYCRKIYTPDDELINELRQKHHLDDHLEMLRSANVIHESHVSKLAFYQANGCNRCNGQGYIGRLGIYEILQITPKLQAAINNRSDNNTIQAIALEEGMKTMFVDGLIKVLRGEIDLQELLLVAYN